jgi:large subunit ribosomal protein L25
VSEVKISAEPRTEFGKGGARRTRRAGKVPAVVYGHGADPKHIALPALEFAAAIRHGGMTTVFELQEADGTRTLALPKAIQRDAIKDTFEHVDLVIVRRGEKVTVEVPVHLTGAAAAGTLVMTEHDHIGIIAEALHLPESLEASIEGLEAGSHVTAGDIKLPRGVELAGDAETILAVVTVAPTAEELEGPTAEAPEGEEEEEAAEGEEAAAPEAAAPAQEG